MFFYLLKRHYFLINILLSVVIALAGGMLAGQVLNRVVPVKPAVAAPAPVQATLPVEPRKKPKLSDYDRLLTGNLLRDSHAAPSGTESGGLTDLDGLQLVGTVSGPREIQSATFRLTREKVTREYSAGEVIGGYRIAYIGRGFAWFKSPDGRRVKLSHEAAVTEKKYKLKQAPPAEVKSSLVDNGLVEAVLPKDKWVEYLNRPVDIMGIILKPLKKQGRVIGHHLKKMREGHFFHTLGARTGDILTRVNSIECVDYESLLRAWEDVKNSDHSTVEIIRDGKPLTFEVAIR